MESIVFDTLKMVERLESAGVPLAQAKAQAAVLADVMRAEELSIVDRFVTKAKLGQESESLKTAFDKFDSKLEQLEMKFDSKLEQLEMKFDSKLEQLDSKLEQLDMKFTSKLEQLDAKIDKTAAEVKSDLVRWVVSIGIVQVGLLTAIFKLVP